VSLSLRIGALFLPCLAEPAIAGAVQQQVDLSVFKLFLSCLMLSGERITAAADSCPIFSSSRNRNLLVSLTVVHSRQLLLVRHMLAAT